MSLWGWIFTGVIGWGVWSALPSDSCVRVHRAAAPIRGAGAVIQFAIKNWADPKTNTDLENQVNDLSSSAEQFFGKEFYGNNLSCRWGNTESNVGFGSQTLNEQTQKDQAAQQAKSTALGLRNGH